MAFFHMKALKYHNILKYLLAEELQLPSLVEIASTFRPHVAVDKAKQTNLPSVSDAFT